MTAPHVVTPADLPAPYSGPPLNIGWVGNYRHPWCSEMHFTQSMESLGHHVERWQEDELDWSTVVPMVERLGLQAVFWTRTWPAEMQTVLPVLDELRARGIVSCAVHLDRWFGLDRQHQVDDQPFFRTDLVVSPDDSPLWPEHGVNHFWLPPGVYGPECEPVPPNPRRWPYDVVFVGSHPYPHPEWAKYRSDLLAAFSRAFRGRFGVLPRRGVPIRGRDLQELYATVPVVIGDTCLAGESYRYTSDRIPETLGRGGFLIHPEVRGMVGTFPDDWYVSGSDLMDYTLGDFTGAVDIAKDALRVPGEYRAVAAQGRATVLARDTYAHRMGTVLAVAEGIHGGYRDVNPYLDPAELEAKRIAFGGGCNAVIDSAKALGGNVVGGALLNVLGPPVTQPTSTPTPRHSVQLHRWSAIFEPRPGTTDSEVIGEVWRNDYRVPKEGFSGCVLDVGGNIGAFAVLAAKAGASQVVTVEPDPDNRERLKHHLVLNGVNDRVTVLACAVSGRADGVGRMVGEGGGARWVFDDHEGEIPCTTLENLIGQFGPFEFYKQDAEGAEFVIFEAVPVEALAQVDRIAAEWHGPDGPPGHPGAAHLQHLTGEEFGPLVTKLADAGRVETFGHPRRGGLLHWRRYGA